MNRKTRSSSTALTPIERSFPWRELRKVRHEYGRSRPPIYKVHRWWARRPPFLYQAILTHLLHAPVCDKPLTGKLVLDPFMGGGTTLVEAQGLGAKVVGFDTESLACRITALELSNNPVPSVWDDISNALDRVERKLRKSYGQSGNWEVLHLFWVDSITCQACGTGFDAHPEVLLAQDSKAKSTYCVCRFCSRLHRLTSRRRTILCSCGKRSNLADSNANGGNYFCPWCGHKENIRRYVARTGNTPPIRRLIAKEEINRKTHARRFRGVGRMDMVRFQRAQRKFRKIEAMLPIPKKRVVVLPGDSRPKSYGYSKYRDMFNDRQLLHHGTVLKALLELAEPARSIAILAFSQALETNCMFCPYSPKWRRIAGIFSIHGYMYVTRPVELNPWLKGAGRGTLKNCLARIRLALSSKKEKHEPPRLYWGSLDKSSEFCDSVDYVVTDPPYFDNLDYGYLARFHSCWLRGVGFDAQSGPIRVGGDAISVPRNADEVGRAYFAERLSQIFKVCHQRLKKDGLLVFTFGQRKVDAWHALAEAIASAGFRVTAIYGVESEGKNGFHGGSGNLRWNAILVCRKTGEMAVDRPRTQGLQEAIKTRGLSRADRIGLRMALDAVQPRKPRPERRYSGEVASFPG
jgi:putative DNA methylase